MDINKLTQGISKLSGLTGIQENVEQDHFYNLVIANEVIKARLRKENINVNNILKMVMDYKDNMKEANKILAEVSYLQIIDDYMEIQNDLVKKSLEKIDKNINSQFENVSLMNVSNLLQILQSAVILMVDNK